ncbi:MAG TPA: alpha/beta-hydrolase family protein [Streptosporangiaceae bacterium]
MIDPTPTEEPPVVASVAVPEAAGAPRKPRVVRRALGFGGLTLAFVFCCLSFTPSLLPRSWVLQGAISGVTAVIGYGVGATIGAVVRRFARWEPGERTRRIAWWTLLAAGPLAIVISGWFGLEWQRDLRRLMGMDPEVATDGLLIMLVAVVVFALILFVSRAIRLGTRKLSSSLARFIPKPVAYAFGVVVFALLVIGFIQGVVLDRLVAAANEASSLANEGTTEGITQPTSPQLSGSPQSLIPWHTLGVKGRDFIGKASTPAELSAFSGRPAQQPVRVYAGLESATGFQAQAQLAVRDLERAGGFDRSVLAVIGTTGTGWVDENVPDTLEYMYGGDTAVVAMQYSYLPSWMSFLVDKSKATQASTEMINAVRAKWSTLPAASRPKLVVFGESLGSYGTETAFGDLAKLTAETNGGLLAGPPFSNPIWDGITTGRDAGSPIWRPVYQQGHTVRFGQAPADLGSPATPWQSPRLVYLQNATDPIVWWRPRLLFQSPQWLDSPRGPDVSKDMRWFPFVTFWQVTADMCFSTGVPSGHGHRYGTNVVDGWAAVLTPNGWTPADTTRLKQLLDTKNTD